MQQSCKIGFSTFQCQQYRNSHFQTGTTSISNSFPEIVLSSSQVMIKVYFNTLIIKEHSIFFSINMLFILQKYSKNMLNILSKASFSFQPQLIFSSVINCYLSFTGRTLTGQKKITYKFDDSYCQPKFFPDSIMIITGLHADNKP